MNSIAKSGVFSEPLYRPLNCVVSSFAAMSILDLTEAGKLSLAITNAVLNIDITDSCIGLGMHWMIKVEVDELYEYLGYLY